MDKKYENAIAIIAVIFVCLVSFAIVYQKASIDAFFSGDAGIKYMQIVGLSNPENKIGSFTYPGENIDKNHKFLPAATIEYQNRVYGVFPYIFSLVTYPLFKCAGNFGLYVPPIIGAIFTIFFTYLIIRRFAGFNRGMLSILVMSIASPILFYEVVIWEHTLAAAFTVAGAWCWLKDDGRASFDFAGGFLLGMSAWFRPENYCFILGMAVALAWIRGFSPKKLAGAAIGIVAACSIYWTLNFILFNNPFGIQVTSNMPKGILVTIKGGFVRFPKMLNLIYPISTITGVLFFVITTAFTVFVRYRHKIAQFSMDERILVIFSWGILLFNAFFLYFYPKSTKTIICVFPLIFILAALRRSESDESAKLSKYSKFCFTASAISIIAVLFISPRDGGMQWGPRLLLPSIPIICIGIFALLPDKLNRNEIAFLIAICLFGFSILFRGLNFVITLKISNANFVKVIENNVKTDEFIVTTQRWAPQVAARAWIDHPMLAAETTKKLNEAVNLLKDANIESFWLIHIGEVFDPDSNKPPSRIVDYNLRNSISYQGVGPPVYFEYYTIR